MTTVGRMPNVGTAAPRGPLIVSCESCVTLLVMIALVTPIVVVPGTFFPYVVPRNILFRVVVELAVAIRIVQVLLGATRFHLRRDYILLAFTGFLVAITLSSLFSPARAHSFYGDFERMGGVWAWLHLAGFLLILRTVGQKQIIWLLHVALSVGVAASIHAIAERFSGGDPFTLAGNAGLLAGYLLVGLAIPLYLAVTAPRLRWLYLLGGAIELLAILTAQNRSSALGLVVGGVATMFVLVLRAETRQRRWIPLGVAAGVLVSVVALIVVMREGGQKIADRMPAILPRIAATDFSGVDALRSFQWRAALAGFRERPVFGYGLENHHVVWSAHFDARSEKLGVDVFDRAHNQYLEIMATTGIIGTLTFLGIWVAIGVSLYRALSAGRLTVGQFAILAGVNVAYATYLLFWFVDLSAAIIWLLVAALIAARFNPMPALRERGGRVSRRIALVGVAITAALLVFSLYGHAYIPFRASVALATLDSSRDVGEDAAAAVETIAGSRAQQTSYFGPVLSRFVRTANGGDRLATTHSQTRGVRLDRAFQTAIDAFDAELRRDPLNDRLHTAAAELLLEAATFYDSDEYRRRAIRLLERAVEINPRRTRQRGLLAKAVSDYALRGEQAGN